MAQICVEIRQTFVAEILWLFKYPVALNTTANISVQKAGINI